MSFQLDEVAKVTPEHEAYCKSLLALEGGAMGGGPYAQYGPKLRVIFPGWVGGGNWSPSAFHPDLGYVFVISHDLGNLNKMIPSADGASFSRVGADKAPQNSGGRFWDGARRWPCQQPPWGEILAVNVNTGDVAWRSPLGSFDELDALECRRRAPRNLEAVRLRPRVVCCSWGPPSICAFELWMRARGKSFG
jgi:quinoprotein glucose dehydrogenase